MIFCDRQTDTHFIMIYIAVVIIIVTINSVIIVVIIVININNKDYLKLSEDVLRHIVLCQGVHHKVSGRKSIKYIFLGLGSVRLNKNNKLEKEN